MSSSSGCDGAQRPAPTADRWLSTHFAPRWKIGQGSFGSVYLVRSKHDGRRQYALKKLIGLIEPGNVLTELKIMCDYGGGHENVMGLVASNRVGSDVYLLMKYVPHDRFKDLVNQLTGYESVDYMRQLFGALGYLHRHRIAHRDVKPSNVLYHRRRRRLVLTDFGLSEIYETDDRALAPLRTTTVEENVPRKRAAPQNSPAKRQNGKRARLSPSLATHALRHFQQSPEPRSPAVKRLFSPHQDPVKEPVDGAGAGTRATTTRRQANTASAPAPGPSCRCHCAPDDRPMRCDLCDRKPVQKWNKSGTPGFRAPETILRAAKQGVKVDVWAAGVVMLSLLSGRYPLMRPDDDTAALLQLCLLCGTTEMRRLAQHLGKRLNVRPSPPDDGVDLLKLAAACRLASSAEESSTRVDCDRCAGFVRHWEGGPGRPRQLHECYCGDKQSRQRTLAAWRALAQQPADGADRLRDLTPAQRRQVHDVLYGALTASPDDRLEALVAEGMLG